MSVVRTRVRKRWGGHRAVRRVRMPIPCELDAA